MSNTPDKPAAKQDYCPDCKKMTEIKWCYVCNTTVCGNCNRNGVNSKCLHLTGPEPLSVEAEEDKLKGKDHDHDLYVFQCEEGCDCNYLHLMCRDDDCDYYQMAEGWEGCNVQSKREAELREFGKYVVGEHDVFQHDDKQTLLAIIGKVSLLKKRQRERITQYINGKKG